MAKYRFLERATYVADGKVVSVQRDRVADLDDEQAQSLAGRIAPLDTGASSMFPDGTPIIPAHITRALTPVPLAGDPVEANEEEQPRLFGRVADLKKDAK